MESRKVEKLRKRFASKKRLRASARAAKRWNLDTSPQQDQGEESVYSKSQKATSQSSIGEVDQGSSPLESKNESSSDRSRELDSPFANPMPTTASTPIYTSLQDVSISSMASNTSLYVPTPMKQKVGLVARNPIKVPGKLYVGQACQVLQLVEQVNGICRCATAGCKGRLIPYHSKSCGLGGALQVTFVCNGCWVHSITFNSTLNLAETSRNVVSFALQVAHLISGKTYADYSNTLRCLGIQGVSHATFFRSIRYIYPHVVELLNDQCQEAICEMKGMSNKSLGSFARAVTTGDGVWHQRKFSKNHTFSIRNYLNGALLYYVHLCMRGKDNIVQEALYKGTSKSAEGYAADIAFRNAHTDGMHIEVHWQDGDSSSANSFYTYYPNKDKSKVMLCGGHVARSFGNRLAELKSTKEFTTDKIEKCKKDFDQIDEVQCCCKGRRHRKACGCISPAFLKRCRVNFFCCLLQAKNSPKTFATVMKELGTHHCRDEHEWEGGQCSFHAMKHCDCGKCEDEVLCVGKPYHTKFPLTCELHALGFEIECHRRADQAEDLIHPVLGRGHSNLPEASHSVLIRFRSKDIYLARLHYMMSTNLGLLQSNATYMYHRRGVGYHWISDLFRRLKLPVFSGMDELLKKNNEKRMKRLNKQKLDEAKEKRIRYKAERAAEHEDRKRWVKDQKVQHSYGLSEADDSDTENDSTVPVKRKAFVACNTGKVCKCGSTTHCRITHRDCPLKSKSESNPQLIVKDVDDSDSDSDGAPLSSCCESDDNSDGDDAEYYCTCGALTVGRIAHSRTCPMNPRKLKSKALPDEIVTEIVSTIKQDIPCDVVQAPGPFDSITAQTLNPISSSITPRVLFSEQSKESTQSAVKDNMDNKIELPSSKKQKLAEKLEVGSYVCLHTSCSKTQHLLCRIAEIVGEGFRLCCSSGVLNTCCSSEELAPVNASLDISLAKWRRLRKISIFTAASEPANLEKCKCNFTVNTIDLTGDSPGAVVTEHNWVVNCLYRLNAPDKTTVISDGGWLTDNVVVAAQLLMLQHSPTMRGLQAPVLAETLAFDVHTEPFVQIINVEGIHWCVVSNVDCAQGVVNVYDTMYSTVFKNTIKVIASLVFCPFPTLTIQMMNVERQSNSSDCGVLAINIAFEICGGRDPCRLRFGRTNSIREHLATCLENCMLAPFPDRGERRCTKKVNLTKHVKLHCVCRLPEEGNVSMAQCGVCKQWFHKHCVNIPDVVFTDSKVLWVCNACK